MTNLKLEPVHVLVLMTAVSPWRLCDGRWEREFENDDTGHCFVLRGPRVGPRGRL